AEALGGVTVICSDKTGTLTANEMQLEVLDAGGEAIPANDLRADRARLFEDPITTSLAAALLNSDVDVLQGCQPADRRKQSAPTISGSGTGRALVEAALRAGLDGAELRASFPRLRLEERRNGIQYVVSLHATPDDRRVEFLKGAP